MNGNISKTSEVMSGFPTKTTCLTSLIFTQVLPPIGGGHFRGPRIPWNPENPENAVHFVLQSGNSRDSRDCSGMVNPENEVALGAVIFDTKIDEKEFSGFSG